MINVQLLKDIAAGKATDYTIQDIFDAYSLQLVYDDYTEYDVLEYSLNDLDYFAWNHFTDEYLKGTCDKYLKIEYDKYLKSKDEGYDFEDDTTPITDEMRLSFGLEVFDGADDSIGAGFYPIVKPVTIDNSRLYIFYTFRVIHPQQSTAEEIYDGAKLIGVFRTYEEGIRQFEALGYFKIGKEKCSKKCLQNKKRYILEKWERSDGSVAPEFTEDSDDTTFEDDDYYRDPFADKDDSIFEIREEDVATLEMIKAANEELFSGTGTSAERTDAETDENDTQENTSEEKTEPTLPEDLVFVCAYKLNSHPFIIDEAVFYRRTEEHDELWTVQYENFPFDPDTLTQIQPQDLQEEDLWKIECEYSVAIEGNEEEASATLLDHLFRSRIGFQYPERFLSGGIISDRTYDEIIEKIDTEWRENSAKAKENETEIIKVAKELGLSPTPTGTGVDFWQARCPGTNHHLYINATADSFGCGWCGRKGDAEDLKRFVKEREDKAAERMHAETVDGDQQENSSEEKSGRPAYASGLSDDEAEKLEELIEKFNNDPEYFRYIINGGNSMLLKNGDTEDETAEERLMKMALQSRY